MLKMQSINEIQIDLVSNASFNAYPTNTLSFTNDLHTPVKLQGEWEVALIEIFHPTVVEKDQTKTVNISIYRDVGGQVKTRQFPFEYAIKEKIEEIVKRLNRVFEDMNISFTADPTDNFISKDKKPKFTPLEIKKQQ